MIYEASFLPILLFTIIVITVLTISVMMARQGSSSKNYFAAGGSIPWQVNGIAFAGDYLSAASFLGICGMIAVAGYDGFLYSIGYLAGWIVALFVIAEPLKRVGKFTFADALDSRFQSKGIRLAAGISTLIVSLFYLIPQMVGAGALVVPLLGMPHWSGVFMVGIVVIVIVATAGMKSTTWVQFIKGSLLVVFSLILVIAILIEGLHTKPRENYHEFITLEAVGAADSSGQLPAPEGYTLEAVTEQKGHTFALLNGAEGPRWWMVKSEPEKTLYEETLTIVQTPGVPTLFNGKPKEFRAFYPVGHLSKIVMDGREVEDTGPLDPFGYLRIIQNSVVVLFDEIVFKEGESRVRLWYQKATPGNEILRPGQKFKVDQGSTPLSKLNFISLMLALFLGTAALPHVLIRYYTVPSPKDARKSTILAIVAIGFFYILTLFIGLGAMTGGVLDMDSNNMSAPLLAQSFGTFLFAIISAIAFATVLGTVSGLIVAASGAVAHDLADAFSGKNKMSDDKRVLLGKATAITVGIIAILLGILFKEVNVSFLVGLAFAIAASANFPSLIMMIFWKRTTAAGIIASVITGMSSALFMIMLSPTMYPIYGLPAADAPIPLENPAIISVPLSFLVIIVVSLLTKPPAPVPSEAKTAGA